MKKSVAFFMIGLLAACSTTTVVPGSLVDASDAERARTAVRSAEAARNGVLGVEVVAAALATSPRTASVFVARGLAVRRVAGFALTAAGFTAGSRCGASCVRIALWRDRFAGIREETIFTPGFREPGVRRFDVDLDVEPAGSLARALAAAGAVGCAGFDGRPLAPRAGAFTAPVTLFVPYPPSEPEAADPARTVVPDCDRLR